MVSSNKKFLKEVGEWVRKYRPDEIQKALANSYTTIGDYSKTEGEREYWYKCSQASFNLSSGMNKWLYEIDDEE